MTITNRFRSGGVEYGFADIRSHLARETFDALPFAARVLAENVVRHLGKPGFSTRELDLLTDRR